MSSSTFLFSSLTFSSLLWISQYHWYHSFGPTSQLASLMSFPATSWGSSSSFPWFFPRETFLLRPSEPTLVLTLSYLRFVALPDAFIYTLVTVAACSFFSRSFSASAWSLSIAFLAKSWPAGGPLEPYLSATYPGFTPRLEAILLVKAATVFDLLLISFWNSNLYYI